MSRIKKEYNYEELGLIPRKCVVLSRDECDITTRLGSFTFKSPVVPANMSSVVDQSTCEYLARKGYFYVMHRFIPDIMEFMNFMIGQGLYTSISVGVNEKDYNELVRIERAHITPDFITVDIAHGWSSKAEKMIKYISDTFEKSFIIAGNVCTPDAVKELELWGADAVKVGIAGGGVCITKNKTGFCRPMGTTVLECANEARGPIIADGGIKEIGHIAISLALGATMVMAGQLFAGYDQSAGEIFHIPNINGSVKKYFGSASTQNKYSDRHIEGSMKYIKCCGDMQNLLNDIEYSLKSACSYAGGKDLKSLKDVNVIKVKKDAD